MRTPTLMERATQAYDHTREYATERAEEAKKFMHHKPYLTTLLGLGTGFVLGMLFMRSVPKVQVEFRTKGKTE